eukprot:4030879-Alexandrium_andersonii.AAC.1
MSARKAKGNIFTWAIDDLQSGELTWGFRHPGREDFVRVQNVATARDRDVLDELNMCKNERAETLAITTYQELFGRLAGAAKQFPEFAAAAAKGGGGPAEDEDDDFDLEEPAQAKPEAKVDPKTPRAAKHSANSPPATPPARAPHTAGLESGGRPPLLVVTVGVGNGNAA